MKFYKYQGCGNDFIIIENSNDFNPQILCKDHYSIGADGVIILKKTRNIYKATIYNKDGSEADTCGNGLRCIGAFLHDKYDISEVKVKVNSCLYLIRFIDNEYEVSFPFIKSVKKEKEYYLVNLVNKHLFTLKDVNIDEYSNKARKKYDVNIEVVKIIDRNNIRIKVNEKGVGNTLSCGSGALAVVSALYLDNLVNNNVTCYMDGGILKVAIKEDCIVLKGEAKFVYKGEM